MTGTLKKILAVFLAAGLLAGSGCGESVRTTGTDIGEETGKAAKETENGSEGKESAAETSSQPAGEQKTANSADWLYAGARPTFFEQTKEQTERVTPSVERWSVAPDLGNVENTWQFYITPGMQEKLVQNGFVVTDSAGNEFFDIYETNRYAMIPNFITVDSLMHTYHLCFDHLLEDVERQYLSEKLKELGVRMADGSRAQYETLSGSEWEEAAKRNMVFFSVGAKLLDDSFLADGAVGAAVSEELSKIERAEGIELSAVTGKEEDYSQYRPRGHYEGDETLERYFKAMMWYGRIHFEQKQEELDRSALLITKALADDADALRLWKRIYAVTSFFAGTSDDAGVCEYAPVMEAVYGREFAVGELAGKEQSSRQNDRQRHRVTIGDQGGERLFAPLRSIPSRYGTGKRIRFPDSGLWGSGLAWMRRSCRSSYTAMWEKTGQGRSGCFPMCWTFRRRWAATWRLGCWRMPGRQTLPDILKIWKICAPFFRRKTMRSGRPACIRDG